ncbi:hypothetical protein MBLNU457_1406t1 [Dothideomycetes sp. NU457]
MATHRHTSIPISATSHPDNPIPMEPKSFMSRTRRRSFASSTSPQSSAPSLAMSDTSDSDTPSTPLTDLQEQMEEGDPSHKDPLPRAADEELKRKRDVPSHMIASTPEDIERLLGTEASGTKFLQKWCCGGGCCKIATVPVDKEKSASTPVALPDSEAFRALRLKLYNLTLDTPLTNVPEMLESNIKLSPIKGEDSKQHVSKVHVQPPEFVQPHPPYHVFSAPLYSARQLTKPGAEKRTYHFDLDITDYPEEGGVDFKVGGAIGICPPNDPELVEDVLNQLGVPSFLRDKPVTLKTGGGRWPTIWGDEAARDLVTTRRELLTWCSDISSTAPTKLLLRVLAEYASAKNEKKILEFLCASQGMAAFCDLRTGPYITLAQLLHAFPSSKPPLEALFGVLPQLMPRFYSLSNDPFESSAREGLSDRRLVEVAVSVHETPNWRGGPRTGVGSGFLERMAKKFVAAEESAHEQEACTRKEFLDIRIPMFRGLMANPLSKKFASDGPMMLIGAGVGMAPFRGFILNRLRNSNCANKIWLVQGVRDSALDEIYAGELGHHEKDIKKVVQSRVPPPVDDTEDGVLDANHTEGDKGAMVVEAKKAHKVAKYVQDEVRNQADIVWFVCNAIDGRIFVCGSSKGMGEGVEEALIDVAMDKGNLNFEEAKEFWQQKKEGGQYIAETW